MYAFGAHWPGAPARSCPTPVGAPCTVCTLPFAARDRGLLGAELFADEDEFVGCLVVEHRECRLMRQIGHDHGVCRCSLGQRAPRELRADALALWDRLARGK